MTDTLEEQGRRHVVVNDVEAKRHSTAEVALERDLSINEWIGRLQGAAKTAHGLARAGEVQAEYDIWTEIAAIAVGRAEQLREVLDGQVRYDVVEEVEIVDSLEIDTSGAVTEDDDIEDADLVDPTWNDPHD